jgi:thiamine biosynthesis lipoprotein
VTAAVRRSWVEQVMGMPASILLRGPSLDGVEALVTAAYGELRRVDELFSTYRADSEISRLRRGEVTAAQLDPVVREVLALCDLAKVETQGWFDVNLPGGLDPSGLVKGWAIERALAVLAEHPEIDVCLNVGGDVAVRVAADGQPFVAGIEDPRDRSRLVASVPLAAGGLATSGTAARGLHIVDPHTGRPVAEIASVSVVGPSLMWADIYATAAFARGRGGLAWLESLSLYDALVVHLDGHLETTPGWPGTGRP